MAYKGKFLVKRDTTANWVAHKTFIPEKGQIIVFTDYGVKTDDQGNEVLIPGVKIGDGKAYVVDLPFIGCSDAQGILDELRAHEHDQNIHVSAEDRRFWNGKLNYEISGEALVLTNN